MLRQFISSYDNGQSIVIYPLGMNQALSVVIVSWQKTEHGYISRRYKSCSVSCHGVKTTVRTWWYIPQVWNMLCQLSSSHANGQSMVIYVSSMKHAPLVVIVSWQRSEHGDISVKYETCFVSCHRLMTTVRARSYIPQVLNMLRRLSSSHDNGQSMVINPLGIKHAPSVVIDSRQWSEHDGISFMYGGMLRHLSSSNYNCQSMVIYP